MVPFSDIRKREGVDANIKLAESSKRRPFSNLFLSSMSHSHCQIYPGPGYWYDLGDDKWYIMREILHCRVFYGLKWNPVLTPVHYIFYILFGRNVSLAREICQREVVRLQNLEYIPAGLERGAGSSLSSKRSDDCHQELRLLERTQASVLNWLGKLYRSQGKGKRMNALNIISCGGVLAFTFNKTYFCAGENHSNTFMRKWNILPITYIHQYFLQVIRNWQLNVTKNLWTWLESFLDCIQH